MVRTLSDKQLAKYVGDICGSTSLTFAPIRQGLANSVFKAQDGQQAWAVKLLGPSAFSAVNYQTIYGLQQQLAAAQLAPQVLAYEPSLRVWIEEWIETPDEALSEHRIPVLAEALARIHSIDITAPTLALLPCWQHYLEQLKVKQARQFAHERDKLAPVISQYSHYQDFCFCHNDLSFDHLVGPARHQMIDWEYAAVGNRYFDLAACALINELNETQQSVLCLVYAKRMALPVEKVMSGLTAFTPVVDFTNRLWTAAAKKQ